MIINVDHHGLLFEEKQSAEADIYFDLWQEAKIRTREIVQIREHFL